MRLTAVVASLRQGPASRVAGVGGWAVQLGAESWTVDAIDPRDLTWRPVASLAPVVVAASASSPAGIHGASRALGIMRSGLGCCARSLTPA